MSLLCAPVVLFCYNRPWHLRRTIEALRRNSLAPATDLIIFSDGPRGHGDTDAVRAVRAYCAAIDGFRRVSIIAREENRGLARSIIEGVGEVLAEHETVIVLEDDLVTSPFFLAFMNDALTVYRDDDRVISIHGYTYPVAERLPELFFLRGADCWGWATWRRGWRLFEADGAKLYAELVARKLTGTFDFDGSYRYSRMLCDQIRGRNDSWAVRWYASAFLAGKLTLYPGRSLVRHIGSDGSGTHSAVTDCLDSDIAGDAILLAHIPVEENAAAYAAFARFFRMMGRSGLWHRLSAFFSRRLRWQGTVTK